MAETRVEIRQISPWSTFRISLAVGVVGFLVWMAAVGILYIALEGMGFWAQFAELVGGEGNISAGLVMGVSAAVGALWLILMVGLGTLGAVVYNACSGLVGGLRVSLSEEE